jgi:cell division protein FtsB
MSRNSSGETLEGGKEMRGKRILLSACIASLALLVFTAPTVRAQNTKLDDRIQALEDELIKLRAEQQQVKTEQMELKREATEAAAALPEFSYRPGRGVTIMAADKSWSINFSYQLHMHMQNHLDGEANPGGKGAAQFSYNDKFTTGDIFSRRNQPWFIYCWNNCFYEMLFALDADSNEVIGVQRTEFVTHFEQMNPWYPTLWVGNPGGETHRYVSRSSSGSAQVETPSDMLSDSSAHNLSHRAIGFGWRNVALGSGDVFLAFEYAGNPFSSAGSNNVLGGGASAVPSGSIENSDNDDAHTFFVKAGMRPFSATKNKWLQKTKFGFGLSVNSPSLSWAATTRRLRLTSTDRVGRLDLMDIRNIGSGIHNKFEYGMEWGVGPYLLRIVNGLSSFEDKARLTAGAHKGVHGHFWSIANELFLWSPKGFLTGSANTPGSVVAGWNFARADASCGVPGCDLSGEFSRNFVTQKELDVWYWIRPGISVGAWWNWWSAANVVTGDQEGIGCKKGGSEVAGKSCEWHTLNLGLRLDF